MASMTFNNAMKLELAFRKFAAEVAAKGFEVDLENVKFDNVQMKFDITITAIAKDGTVEKTQSEKTFEHLAPRYGIDPVVLGKTIHGSQGPITVTGYKWGRNGRQEIKNCVAITYKGKPNYGMSWHFLRSELLSDPAMRKYVKADKTDIPAPKQRRRRRSFADMF